MKYVLIIVLFIWFIIFKPIDIGKAQAGKKQSAKSILDALDIKKRQLFEQALANEDTLKQAISVKPKKVIVKKVQYIKVYKTVPIYIPADDSDSYKQKMPKDTLENDYLILLPLPLPKGKPPLEYKEPKKKRSFFYRLFHHKNTHLK